MPSSSASWTVLQAIQYRIYSEVLVGSPAASPFSTWNATDQTKYGANPFGTIGTAIFIGVPKDWPSLAYLPRQCHIIPPMNEHVYWRALGGKTWDEQMLYVRFVFSRYDDWYQTQQDMIAARDAMYAMMAKHAELPNAPTVAASKFQHPDHAPPAYHHDEVIGSEWDCWGFGYWVRQEFYPTLGIQP